MDKKTGSLINGKAFKEIKAKLNSFTSYKQIWQWL